MILVAKKMFVLLLLFLLSALSWAGKEGDNCSFSFKHQGREESLSGKNMASYKGKKPKWRILKKQLRKVSEEAKGEGKTKSETLSEAAEIKNYSQKRIMENLNRFKPYQVRFFRYEQLLPQFQVIFSKGFLLPSHQEHPEAGFVPPNERYRSYHFSERMPGKSRLYSPQKVRSLPKVSPEREAYGPLPHMDRSFIPYIHPYVIGHLGEAIVLLSDKMDMMEEDQIQALQKAQVYLMRKWLRGTGKGKWLTPFQLFVYLEDPYNKVTDLAKDPAVFAPHISELLYRRRFAQHLVNHNVIPPAMVSSLESRAFENTLFLQQMGHESAQAITLKKIGDLDPTQRKLLYIYTGRHLSPPQKDLLFQLDPIGSRIGVIPENEEYMDISALEGEYIMKLSRDEVHKKLIQFLPEHARFFRYHHLTPLWQGIRLNGLMDIEQTAAEGSSKIKLQGRMKPFSPKKVRGFLKTSKEGTLYGPLPYMPASMVEYLDPEVLNRLNEAIVLLSDKTEHFREEQWQALTENQKSLLEKAGHNTSL